MKRARSTIPATIVAAALMLAAAGTASAQTMPQNNPAAEANVKQSEHYSQMVHSSPSFRTKRMREECGPITDPQLHAQCVASFDSDGTPQH
ncbi:MAG TPA: hypothetical protein VGM07_23105 [Stellaceae bacterium]|jgi:hypothetical protein